jgi:hypothetical protein
VRGAQYIVSSLIEIVVILAIPQVWDSSFLDFSRYLKYCII